MYIYHFYLQDPPSEIEEAMLYSLLCFANLKLDKLEDVFHLQPFLRIVDHLVLIVSNPSIKMDFLRVWCKWCFYETRSAFITAKLDTIKIAMSAWDEDEMNQNRQAYISRLRYEETRAAIKEFFLKTTERFADQSSSIISRQQIVKALVNIFLRLCIYKMTHLGSS